MGVFDDIKSKLGFSGDRQEEKHDEAYYDDLGYDDGYADEGYDPGYDSYEARGSSGSGAYGAAQSESSGPRLVSIDDVRARTQIPETLNRNPLPARRVSSRAGTYNSVSPQRSFQSNSYRQVERASDYLRSTDTSDVAPLHGETQTMNYDLPSAKASASSSRSSYDPYDAFSGAGISSHNPTRSVTVLKPVSYAEVDRIAKVLKAGDVVVLGLANTQDHLAKRILDFSFGVSSALDASVECIADKVFVVNRGRVLSEEELRDLRTKL